MPKEFGMKRNSFSNKPNDLLREIRERLRARRAPLITSPLSTLQKPKYSDLNYQTIHLLREIFDVREHLPNKKEKKMSLIAPELAENFAPTADCTSPKARISRRSACLRKPNQTIQLAAAAAG